MQPQRTDSSLADRIFAGAQDDRVAGAKDDDQMVLRITTDVTG